LQCIDVRIQAYFTKKDLKTSEFQCSGNTENDELTLINKNLCKQNFVKRSNLEALGQAVQKFCDMKLGTRLKIIPPLWKTLSF